ncbi:MAG TPA: cyclic nucleotide-binding domain-containing protein [Pyrinomonadaceae bacterium]|jgi:Fe-S-cluster-containing dehydrogenase component/CRP-like cAMP-binding protein|nr:cyclic nucleotide-binding domain-containing protein [Pyrinomonadaceae bacterium]
MSHVITDTTEIRKAIQRLEFRAEVPDKLLNEWLEGVKINRTDKLSGSMVRLRVYSPGEIVMQEGEWGGNNFCVLVDGLLDVCMRDERSGKSLKVNEVKPGESFGEMSLFAGVPRTATVIAGAPPAGVALESLVLEIDRPALRSAKQKEKGSEFTQELFERLGEIYQQRGLSTIIEQVRQATGDLLLPEQTNLLQRISRFRIYGRSHKLCQQGSDVRKLFLIRNGWVRRDRDASFANDKGLVVAATASGHIDFLGAGNSLGLESLSSSTAVSWKYTGVVILRTEVMEIDLALLQAQPELSEAVRRAFSVFSVIDENEGAQPTFDEDELVAAEEVITSGIVEAENVLVMDMDLCIRCGNCSLACQKVHGTSRLVRRGIQITRPQKIRHDSTQHILVPEVCIHCQDPECLTYCPTGAIHRGANGQIDINVDTCTGCLQCAIRCPYTAISMISPSPAEPVAQQFATQLKGWFGVEPATLPAAETAKKNLIAAKCNLCENTPLNPPGARSPAYSCQENCPTGALLRVNPREYFAEVEQRLGPAFRSETMVHGRNIHQRDPIRRWCHFAGFVMVATALGGGGWLWWRHGFNGGLGVLHLTLRWLTGWGALVSIVAAMIYSLRRRIYRRRAGPLRYWMLAHIYVGLVAAVTIMIHGGSHGGGLLTASLSLSFDLVLLTGLFGIACYYAAPQLLTSIEGNPLLLEDLQARREELRGDLAGLSNLSDELREQLHGPKQRFGSLRYFLRQLWRREELSAMLAEAREEYRATTERLTVINQEAFVESLGNLATLRRLDALIFLHRLLKIWLPPHIIATSIMLGLLIIHIIQVLFFAVH